jgi:hypothetical protein
MQDGSWFVDGNINELEIETNQPDWQFRRAVRCYAEYLIRTHERGGVVYDNQGSINVYAPMHVLRYLAEDIPMLMKATIKKVDWKLVHLIQLFLLFQGCDYIITPGGLELTGEHSDPLDEQNKWEHAPENGRILEGDVSE